MESNNHVTGESFRDALIIYQQAFCELEAKVEEMQKTLEWYADEENHKWHEDENDPFVAPWTNALNDKGYRARSCLKGGTK